MSTAAKQTSVTIYDVAREAGTSKSTVARVLTRNGYVSARTSSAVINAVNRLGYRPDEQARRLAKGRFENVVDIFTVELDYGIALRRIKTIHGLLEAKGFEVSYHVSGLKESSSVARTIRKLRSRKPCAIVACTWAIDEEAIAELNGYMQEGGIVVCFGTDEHLSLACDQVLFDEEKNAYMSAKYLLDMGHVDIGYNSHGDRNPDHPRIRGMKTALAEAGVAFHPEWIHHSSVYEVGGAELAAWYLGLEHRPSAMCVNNDVVASIFVQQLYRAGLRVPEDVSVVGYDNEPASEHCLVPLTVASQPVRADSEMVASFLTERLSHKYDGAPRIIINNGELIQRQSVARFPREPLQPIAC